VSSDTMLKAGDQVPHVTVRSADGTSISYGDLWQQKNLLLVLLADPGSPGSEAYLARLRASMADLTAHDTASIVTSDRIPGAPAPGVLIADRWGEIWYVHQADSDGALPTPDALVEGLRHVQLQCPECQGEAR
jgi:hypothetical protein